jgi:hypothetical protein
MTVDASVIWSDNFNGYASDSSFLTAANPVFKTGMSTGTWARGDNTVVLLDEGGGDKAIRWGASANSRGFAIWLSVATLNLTAGNTYSMTFDIANYVGGATDGFANVIKAKGVDAGGIVTFDLLRGSNFDQMVSSGGATIGMSTNTTTASTSLNIGAGGIQFGASGSHSVDFVVNAGDEYIGLAFGSQDRNTTQVTFDLDNVSVIPEPATIGMLGLGAVLTILLRRMSTR